MSTFLSFVYLTQRIMRIVKITLVPRLDNSRPPPTPPSSLPLGRTSSAIMLSEDELEEEEKLLASSEVWEV